MSSHSYVKNDKNSNIFINIDGKLFHRSEAKISVFDSGFLLGDGVWEGIRLHNNQLLFIDDHLTRLFKVQMVYHWIYLIQKKRLLIKLEQF